MTMHYSKSLMYKYNTLECSSRIICKAVLWGKSLLNIKFTQLQWWFVNWYMFVLGGYFWINEFSGLLNRQSVQKQKSVPALFVQISEISCLSEPGLTNHQCILLHLWTINRLNLTYLLFDNLQCGSYKLCTKTSETCWTYCRRYNVNLLFAKTLFSLTS